MFMDTYIGSGLSLYPGTIQCPTLAGYSTEGPETDSRALLDLRITKYEKHHFSGNAN